MALIKCPECGKEISDKAASCPNCGCPVRQEPIECLEEYEEVEKNEDENEKELGVSIASLVCYILAVIFNVLSIIPLGAIFSIAMIVLVIVSFLKKGKCTCANIVFWINTVSFIVVILGAIILSILG